MPIRQIRHGVEIDSGPVTPDWQPRDLPKDKWAELVKKRAAFLARDLPCDCRCLIRYVRDAEEMYQHLGYQSADDLIENGYRLNPEEIRLAAQWLGIRQPEFAVKLPEAIKGGRRLAKDLAADPNVKPLASPGKAKGNNVDKINIRPNGTSAAYLVRRLKRDHPDIAQQLAQGKFKSARAAGIAAGIVKVPTPLHLLRKDWTKASKRDQHAFLSWLCEHLGLTLVKKGK
jgi:hypothetical protein